MEEPQIPKNVHKVDTLVLINIEVGEGVIIISGKSLNQ